MAGTQSCAHACASEDCQSPRGTPRLRAPCGRRTTPARRGAYLWRAPATRAALRCSCLLTRQAHSQPLVLVVAVATRHRHGSQSLGRTPRVRCAGRPRAHAPTSRPAGASVRGKGAARPCAVLRRGGWLAARTPPAPWALRPSVVDVGVVARGGGDAIPVARRCAWLASAQLQWRALHAAGGAEQAGAQRLWQGCCLSVLLAARPPRWCRSVLCPLNGALVCGPRDGEG